MCGFGASGRNGGWCSALFPASLDQLAKHRGPGRGRRPVPGHDRHRRRGRPQHGGAPGIDCHWAHGGTLTVGHQPCPRRSDPDHVTEQRRWGFGPEDDVRWLTPAEAMARVRVHGVGGRRVHAALRRGAPGHASSGAWPAPWRHAGVAVHEGTRVLEIHPGVVRTDHGTVRADTVLRCTEAFTATLPGGARDVVPLYSMMIATEPLPADVWDADRPGGPGDLQRRPAPAHLRPAHRGRPVRLRRAGRAVPLRFGHGRPLRPGRAGGRRPGRGAAPALPRHPRRPHHPPLGRRRWPCPGTGLRRSASTATPAWAGPAATWATACRPPTWPDGPWPTWCWAGTPT